MSKPNGEPTEDKRSYRKILLTDAAWETIQRAVLLREATTGIVCQSTPEMFGNRLDAIVSDWLKNEAEAIRDAIEEQEVGLG